MRRLGRGTGVGMLLGLLCAGACGDRASVPGGQPQALTPTDRVRLGRYDPERMSPDEIVAAGEILVFGRIVGGQATEGDVGRALCPMCHTVVGLGRTAAPDLTPNEAQTQVPIGRRGEIRFKDPRYHPSDRARTGRATTNLEYIVESHLCPACYVVAGFGTPGSGDRDSPMVPMYLPPNCQTVDEEIMITSYLFAKDGLAPPPPAEIRAAYARLHPEPGQPVHGC